MGIWSIEFPCGMVIKTKSLSEYFSTKKDLDKLYLRGCPLHGFDCLASVPDEIPPLEDEEGVSLKKEDEGGF